MLRRVSALLSLLVLLFTLGASTQVARFLAIEGEGTASVVLDSATKEGRTAYITDGGQGGQLGFQGARINGKEVLQYLLDEGVNRLVITCSHPHSDHMAGLKAAVRDPKIQEFEVITFIDNDYDKPRSLFKAYEKEWGKQGKPEVKYSPANNQDAFAGLARKGSSVRVSNFVYDLEKVDPTPGKKGIHGRSVITQYEISEKGKTVRLVDFDDASSKLIASWAGREPPPRLDVLVVPHHGSINNNLSPILDQRERLGLMDVIITVNRDNQYSHPSPEVLRQLLVDLKPDHVFVTGSVIGDNIDVTARGVRVKGGVEGNRQRLASLIELRLDHQMAVAEAQVDRIRGRLQGKLVLKGALGGRPLDRKLIDSLAAQRILPRSEIVKLRRSVEAIENLEASLDLAKPDTRRKPLLAALGRRLDPLSFDGAPGEPGPRPRPDPGRNGVKRYYERYQEAAQESERHSLGSDGSGNGVGGPDGNGHPPPPGGPRSSPPQTGPSAPGSIRNIHPPSPGGGGATMFRRMLARPVPIWGGIILGNDPDSGGLRPVNLLILELPGAGNPQEGDTVPVLRFFFKDGSIADYTGLTPTELWAGYNFVAPSSELKERYGVEIPGNAAGLVGITKNRGDAWEFAIHPAIADTFLARDAMRVDMMISTARTPGMTLPVGFEGIPWSDLRYQTYQWYDEPAHILVQNGRILVETTSGPEECLMRVRLVSKDYPDWFNPRAAKESSMAELEKRLLALPVSVQEMPQPYQQQIVKDIANKLAREIADSRTESDESLNPELGPVCRGFEALRSIDRLARLVAILNWYTSESGQDLPPLPGSVRPVREEVPATWPVSAVFAADSTPRPSLSAALLVIAPFLGLLVLGGLWLKRGFDRVSHGAKK